MTFLLRLYFLWPFFYELTFYDFFYDFIFCDFFPMSLFFTNFPTSLFSILFSYEFIFYDFFLQVLPNLTNSSAPAWHPKSRSGHWGCFDFVFAVWHFWAAGSVFVSGRIVALQVWPCVQNTYKNYFRNALLPAGFTAISISQCRAWPSRMTPRTCTDSHCWGS